MKYIDEYRDADTAQQYARAIAAITTQPWTIMEICGGQTHSIVKFGIDELLPQEITLIHGPGCPVCVTPVESIDMAIAIASRPEVIFASFGDMLRVPGSREAEVQGSQRRAEVSSVEESSRVRGFPPLSELDGAIGVSRGAGEKERDLLAVKAIGGDIRIVYSPLNALKIAQAYPQKQVVFFAVGFETTAPATAMAVYQAAQQKITNFSLLVSHVLVPPAMEAILASPHNRVQGFLAAGHVCTVMGYTQYETIVQKYRIPIVVTGFEPLDILQGIYMCIKQLEERRLRGAHATRTQVENQYTRSVRRDGNETAQQLMREVFEIVPRKWRGIGEISQSGYELRDKYAEFDAQRRFEVANHTIAESAECISGQILQGMKKPHECPAFGKRCTPEHPLGAPMVSSEGACAAYYRYRQQSSLSLAASS